MVAVSAVFVESLYRMCSFLFFQEFGFLRKVDDEEPCNDRCDNCHNTFDDEDPSPAVDGIGLDL